MRSPLALGALCLLLAPVSARAGLYEMSVAGTIGTNTTLDPAIPVGSQFEFQLVYDTAAPDLDTEGGGSADPTFGRFGNTGAPPALHSFHYSAGSYAVSIGDPSAFGTGSIIDITFTSVNAIDVNIFAPSLFPQLGGNAVSFHADFNHFSGPPIFTSDGLPTDPTIGPEDFEGSTVSLLPASGTEVSGSTITAFAIRPVPEPSLAALALASGLLLLGATARRA